MPSLVNSKEWIWFEWAIPRDLRMNKPRWRSPLLSRLRRLIQASINEETPTTE